MKVGDAVRGVATLFLDTAPIIYYVEANPAYIAAMDVIFDQVDAGALAVVTSPW